MMSLLTSLYLLSRETLRMLSEAVNCQPWTLYPATMYGSTAYHPFLELTSNHFTGSFLPLHQASLCCMCMLQVLLSLGVSYTNELDQKQALNYLYTWLAQHAKHGPQIANALHPDDTSQRLNWVVGLFEQAAASSKLACWHLKKS